MDADNGWQIVIPETDTKPHATIILIDQEKNTREGEVAGWDCPCRPQIDWKDQIIIHNSFEEMTPPPPSKGDKEKELT